jgi:hypothetical protein
MVDNVFYGFFILASWIMGDLKELIFMYEMLYFIMIYYCILLLRLCFCHLRCDEIIWGYFCYDSNCLTLFMASFALYVCDFC